MRCVGVDSRNGRNGPRALASGPLETSDTPPLDTKNWLGSPLNNRSLRPTDAVIWKICCLRQTGRPKSNTLAGARPDISDSAAGHAEGPNGGGENDHIENESEFESQGHLKGTDKGKSKESNVSHKQVLDLPGPDPDELHSPARAKPKHISHSRVSSLAHNSISDQPSAKPPSSSSPGSSKKPISHHRGTPDSIADDQSSVGDGPKQTRVRKTETERKEFLEKDAHSGEVEPHRMFCNNCNEWVQLNPTRRYVMRLWLEHHKHEDAPVVPTTILEQARDPQECGLPDAPLQTTLIPDNTTGVPGNPKSPAVVPKTEPPTDVVALTELPFAQVDASPGKRTREDSEDEVDERRVRPRTEAYESPEGDAPGLLDWLLLPIRTFVRGFKEGMSSS
ncbi:hypothetical protein OBBRIDRAFT_523114 [Obba rivulosa]|uniref:Uncharacterized protein n=1 Tax=Obba rivulosa TaxID=1052685 RepID=A0A8E2DLZ3_9APHY|nr:hypothetical protein OBBRIDRAFT_523114 [Obba rivulosa]